MLRSHWKQTHKQTNKQKKNLWMLDAIVHACLHVNPGK